MDSSFGAVKMRSLLALRRFPMNLMEAEITTEGYVAVHLFAGRRDMELSPVVKALWRKCSLQEVKMLEQLLKIKPRDGGSFEPFDLRILPAKILKIPEPFL